MPQIIDKAPLGWQDLLNQQGYQKPTQNPFTALQPQPLAGPAIPPDDFLIP